MPVLGITASGVGVAVVAPAISASMGVHNSVIIASGSLPTRAVGDTLFALALDPNHNGAVGSVTGWTVRSQHNGAGGSAALLSRTATNNSSDAIDVSAFYTAQPSIYLAVMPTTYTTFTYGGMDNSSGGSATAPAVTAPAPGVDFLFFIAQGTSTVPAAPTGYSLSANSSVSSGTAVAQAAAAYNKSVSAGSTGGASISAGSGGIAAVQVVVTP